MHLLDEDAFDDKKPDKLIQGVLNNKADGKKIHFHGKKAEGDIQYDKEIKEA